MRVLGSGRPPLPPPPPLSRTTKEKTLSLSVLVLVCTDLQLRAGVDLSPGIRFPRPCPLTRETRISLNLESEAFCPLTLVWVFEFKSDKLLPSRPNPPTTCNKKRQAQNENTSIYVQQKRLFQVKFCSVWRLRF